MGSFNSGPGTPGIVAIIGAIVTVSIIITKVAHSYSHWPVVVLGVIVGLMAVSSINR